jgi:hypothetical protein
VLLYAIRALPPGEARVAETCVSTCAACRQEMETLRPVVESFVAWPTNVLRPAVSLWHRVAQRIATETGAAPLPPAAERHVEPQCIDVAPGIACKLLATDGDNHRVSMLVRLAPGTDYPPHRHEGTEELHMLDGELIVDDATYYPGDYRRAEPGTVDRRVWSQTGCTCVLITSFRDAIG